MFHSKYIHSLGYEFSCIVTQLIKETTNMKTNILYRTNIFSSYIKTIWKNLVNVLYRSKSAISELFGYFFDTIITTNKCDFVMWEKCMNNLYMKPGKSRVFSEDDNIIILTRPELFQNFMKISRIFPINYQHEVV
jgi:hypothetical protein